MSVDSAASVGSAMTVPPVLLRRLLDDAAVFPPGDAPMADAVAAHAAYQKAWYAGLVGRLVVPSTRWAELVDALPEAPARPLDVSLVVPDGPSAVASAVALTPAEPRVVLRAVETPAGGDLADATATVERLRLDVPVFLELAPGTDLAALTGSRTGAKFRTGGDSTPSAGRLATAITEAVARGVRFKLTAGLHHAVAGPRQHGFLDVLLAVDAALHGNSVDEVAELLGLRQEHAVVSRVRALSAERCRRVRETFVSFGTCSIDEPVADLVGLGLLRP